MITHLEQIIECLGLPEKTMRHLLGDYSINDMPRVMSSLIAADGDISKVKSIAENAVLDSKNRLIACETLLICYVNEKYSFSDLENFYVQLLQRYIDKDIAGSDEKGFAARLAGYCIDVYAQKTFPLIELLFEQDKIDLSYISQEDFAHYGRFKDKDTVLERLKHNECYTLSGDIAVTS